MASSFPFVLRVAAGLLSDTVDVVKRIPDELPTLGVTLVGRAAKLSFELNQQLSALAVRGDNALSALSGGAQSPPERTAWSTIDDEDEVAANDPQAAARWNSVAEAESAEPGYKAALFDEFDDAETEAPGIHIGDSAGSVGSIESAESVADDVPNTGIPDYQMLSLAQLRGKLRAATAEQLTAALEFEQTHQSRPAFLTLLTNRLSTLAGR